MTELEVELESNSLVVFCEIMGSGPAGKDGRDGIDGAPGVPGADGHTPEKGIDYFTEGDVAQIAAAASEQVYVPQKVSEFENDAGYLNKHQSLDAYRTAAAQDEIDNGLSQALGDKVEAELSGTSPEGADPWDVREELDGKQDALTFDSVPTVGSSNPVTSGGVAMVLPKMDLLWVNQSPAVSFSAQTISLDLEGYDFLLLEAIQASGGASNVACFTQMIPCRIGMTFSLDASQRLPESGNGAFCGRYRNGRITASGIELDSATVYNINGNAVNSYSANVSWAVIPQKIYGIKIAINDLTGG